MESREFFKRYWYYIVIALVILVVLIVVLVVVIRKHDKSPPPKTKKDAGNITLENELVIDIPVSSSPILSEIFELMKADIDSTPPPPGMKEMMKRPQVTKMFELSKRQPNAKELKEMEQVEDYLHSHGRRPWGKEGDVSEHWNYRFGKYIRKGNTAKNLPRISQLIGQLCSGADDKAGSNSLGGYFYYPPGGCREWHTNKKDWIGWRGYFIYCPDGDNMSDLNVLDPKTHKMTRIPDKSGVLRLFKVTSSPPLWHSVSSSTHRYSLGFRLADKCVDRLKKQL